MARILQCPVQSLWFRWSLHHRDQTIDSSSRLELLLEKLLWSLGTDCLRANVDQLLEVTDLRGAERQFKTEGATLTNPRAFGPDAPAVRFNDRFDDHQAQPRAAAAP